MRINNGIGKETDKIYRSKENKNNFRKLVS